MNLGKIEQLSKDFDLGVWNYYTKVYKYINGEKLKQIDEFGAILVAWHKHSYIPQNFK